MTTPFTGSDFVGSDRDNGFGLQFVAEGDTYTATYTFKPHQQGPLNIAHGGAIAALVDEAMTSTVYQSGKGPAYTVNLNIAFRNPAYIGQEVRIIAKITSVSGRKIYLRTEIFTDDGAIAAEADGLFIRLDDAQDG